MKRALWALPVAVLAVFASSSALADDLMEGFVTPPDSAKPRTWWHWVGGNVTTEGITKDLEWMKRVGIGGFQLCDVSSGGGQGVDQKIEFRSEPWLGAVKHSAEEADRLGLEMSIFSSAGWSETGGPWVKPEQAMKKLVWSEVTVTGPVTFKEKLPSPPSNNGPIGNLRVGRGSSDPTFYGDSAVLAYPTPGDEGVMAEKHPTVTSSAGEIDGKALMDGDLNTAVSVAAGKDGAAWVQYEFSEPYTARAVTIEGRGGIPVGRICASDDGKEFRTLVELPGAQLYRGGLERTFTFPATTAKYFRMEMTARRIGAGGDDEPGAAGGGDRSMRLGELVFHSGKRGCSGREEKAGFCFLYDYEAVRTPATVDADAIARDGIVDLTSKMGSDGTLTWDVPAGKWTIMRVGYSLTGGEESALAGPTTGLGYEVDKLSREDVESYFHGLYGSAGYRDVDRCGGRVCVI